MISLYACLGKQGHLCMSLLLFLLFFRDSLLALLHSEWQKAVWSFGHFECNKTKIFLIQDTKVCPLVEKYYQELNLALWN